MNEIQDATSSVSIWVNEYSDHLYSWALYKTSSKEVAQDLVQETFLSAFQSFKNYAKKSSPKTWLTAILNNKILDHYRKKMKEDKLPDSNHSFNENGTWKNQVSEDLWAEQPHLLDNPDFNATLASCMDNLPEKWRLSVLAKYTLEKKPEEICQELGISMSNYWQMIHRAKLQLKGCLDKNWV
jgi:RNA polymerase sigma-70 factor (ECF subfamily)